MAPAATSAEPRPTAIRMPYRSTIHAAGIDNGMKTIMKMIENQPISVVVTP